MIALVAAAVVCWQAMHRSSSLVRRWGPSAFPRRGAGPLSVLDSGTTGRDDERTIVFLHGLGATGDYFGAFYDGLSRRNRVVIIDLLGFGHSLDETRSEFGIDDHVAALDAALDSLGVTDQPVVLAAHSMSTAIALTWADRNSERTGHVYLWGPPIYPDDVAAQAVAKEYGPMGRLFALDAKWAERACRLSCSNRDVSGRVMALMAPRWPTQISRVAGRHTWEAYHLSLRNLIFEFDWSRVLPAGVPVTVFHGANDPIGDQAHIAKMIGRAKIAEVPGADHHVALQHPQLLFDALGER
ncbi:MAG: alpha/beta fold hydrolase [Ilumatobacter sp.]|uniref:alpha/beta fold hydrolase n=1 Tax=Ilumatobacter sp. TaxID=1967498 RepID=UPI00329879FF